VAAVAAAAAAAAERDELVIGITQFPANWHPAIDAMAAKGYIVAMASRPFTVYDADWKLVCLLCTGLPTLEDGTAAFETRADGKRGVRASFTIDPRARWGDGTPITTKDVLFTWTVGRHPQSGFSNADLFARDIVDITVDDDRRFTIHRERPVCGFDEINDFHVLPAHIEGPVFAADPAAYRTRSHYETDTTNPGLWSGPYRITAVEPGSHVVLERNPHWWGAAPAFRRIVVKAVENTAALEANLLAGQVDMIPGEVGLPLDQVLALEKRHGARFAITTRPGLFYEHIDVNLDNPALQDVRVRRALLHALDRESISRQLFAGRQPVANGLVHPLDRFFTTDIPVYAYDRAAAIRLLDEAGWSAPGGGIRTNARGERLVLDIMTTAGNRSRELVEQVLQSQWKAVGVDVRIVNEPARVLFGQTLRERRFKAMALFAWLSAPESIPRSTLHSSMVPTAANGWAGQNFPGLRDPETDRIVDDLDVVCEPEARRDLWARLQRRYAEILPALPLFFRADGHILPPWLDGVVPTGHQYPASQWVETWRVNMGRVNTGRPVP
jgi:peptide/nickel transport system substrate-binding protein